MAPKKEIRGKNLSVKNIFEKLRPVLEEYLKKQANVQQLIQHGTFPSYVCKRCPDRKIVSVKKFSEEVKNNTIPSLIDWFKENGILSAKSDGTNVTLTSRKSSVEGVKGKVPVLYTMTTTPYYEYEIPSVKFEKKPFYEIFKQNFSEFSRCEHIMSEELLKESLPVIISEEMSMDVSYRFSREVFNLLESPRTETSKLQLLCKKCYRLIESVKCKRGLALKIPFSPWPPYYPGGCPPIRGYLLQESLKMNGITYDVLDKRRAHADFPPPYHLKSFMLFLPELATLITNNTSGLDDIVNELKPNCILAFGTRESLFHYLGFGVDVIIFNDSPNATQRFFLFDKSKRVEESIENIAKNIVDKLDIYFEEIGGKIHDRLVASFRKIGQELNFIVPPWEAMKRGSRIDQTWLDREGSTQVAVEVETSSSWKKDIISTWEAKPKLAVILIHDKTGQTIRNIIQYSPLQYMLHMLLLVNFQLKKAYLIEKQNILKIYDLKTKMKTQKTEVFYY